MTHQLLRGSVQHFLYVGICHGMACEDGAEFQNFVAQWEQGFLDFLSKVPKHYDKVMLESQPLERDPWAKRFIGDRDPEYVSEFDGET